MTREVSGRGIGLVLAGDLNTNVGPPHGNSGKGLGARPSCGAKYAPSRVTHRGHPSITFLPSQLPWPWLTILDVGVKNSGVVTEPDALSTLPGSGCRPGL